jgi:peptide/nickel transport system substrate-binding protein
MPEETKGRQQSSGTDINQSRRKLLAGASGVVIAGLAGCGGSDNPDDVSGDDDGGSESGQQSGGQEMGEPVEPFAVTYTSRDQQPGDYGHVSQIIPVWRELGLEIEHRTLEFGQESEAAYVEHDFDARQTSWGGSPSRIDPDFFCYVLGHSSQTAEGLLNYWGFENEEYDEHAEAQRQTYDNEERLPPVQKCQEIFMEEQAYTPMVARKRYDPFNAERIERDSLVPMLGNGIAAFWNNINMELKGENVLRSSHSDPVHNLNPLDQRSEAQRYASRKLYDRLLRVGPDATPELWAAESWEVVDETTIEVVMRDDMNFHDGEPIDAEDVKFSFEFQKEHGSLQSSLLVDLDNIEITDDYTLKFNLGEPSAPFIMNGLGYAYIMPKHVWEDVDNPADYANEEAIGSGPFQLVDHRVDEELHLEAFDDHFNPPKMDEMRRVVGSDRQAAYRLLETGEVDVTPATTHLISDVNQLLELDNIEVFEAGSHGHTYITYNQRREPFDDKAFRRALAYATPKQQILETHFENVGDVAQSYITEANEYWHNPDVDKFNLDLDKAREELEQAGYTWDDDGRLRKPP